MSTSTIIKLVIRGFILYVSWFVARPYVDKYRLEKAVENIAQYTTINTVERAESEFKNRIIDLGRNDITTGMLFLEKDEETNHVKAVLKYKDEIKIFGHVFKKMEFTIIREAAKVDKII